MSCRKWKAEIFRWHEGWLDRESEAALLSHLSRCAQCRNVADKSSEIGRLLAESPVPAVPPFLKERIVSRVVEEMRQDSWTRALQRFMALFAYFRPAVAGIVLMVGIGLGVFAGSNLSHFINASSARSSYDVLVQAGIEGGGSDSSLDFIWTDANRGGR